MIIVEGNWLTIRNVHIAIYQYASEITELDTFKWLKLIVGFFYLQITILKTFFQILQGKSKDASSLSWCHNTLRCSKVSKNMKNFHVCNNFFKMVINTNLVVFCITFARSNNISAYKKWLCNLNQPEEIFRLENLNLNFFEV